MSGKYLTALGDWEHLNEFLRDANEEDALALLNIERAGAARIQFLVRIFGRYNTLRGRRERMEIVKEAKR